MPTGPTEPFRLRAVALPAFAPTIVNGIGHAAILPVLALHARDLGATVGQAAFVVALLGIGSLLTSLPAGAFVARVGERRALALAGILDAVAMAAAALSPSLPALALAILLSGVSWSVFLLARQGFLISVTPSHLLARAMSTLGGSHRVGAFVGPTLGAGLIAWSGDLRAVFWLAAAMALTSTVIILLVRDITPQPAGRARTGGEQEGRGSVVTLRGVLVEHRRVLLTLGSAVLVIGGARSLRATVLPLWADHVGISAEATSLVFGVAAFVEILLFYPAGWTMDRFGRTVVAVPVVVLIGIGVALLPLADGLVLFTVLAVVMAVGNGMGSGIVMTLGADTAPAAGRAQYLGGWRLAGDVGTTSGPLTVTVLTAVWPLAAACVVTGVLCLAGSLWVWRRVAASEETRRARLRDAGSGAGPGS
ncbi:MFS transporter [Ornithinimicrobium cerasi]|uniref:Predicted arabinose efflux permease, MFS family n=1 Tax=Ornithinimicrobium cerasi TaxID=2248773 RepID=A0A285VQY8_9MICO|nr:MFS transporter [Ornithinimicrobium cerasi]SOC55031.1 Predicted arabinose efflux permease, MFS family [Ornithinimicrobium cerasi]